ncbi:dockerin type I domain-containing protein [Patescibacteria group bacterium]
MKMRPIFYLLILFILLFSFYFVGLQAQDTKAQLQDWASTSVTIILLCGDGYAEHISGEVCDPGDPPAVSQDIGTSTCPDFNDIFGNPFLGGDLSCLDDCTDFDTSQCNSCGNGSKEGSEECDGSDLGGESCTSLGFISGSLSCMPNCVLNTTDCVSMAEEGGTPGSGPRGGASAGDTGFDPGSDEEEETKVIVRGKSYPSSDVHILVDGRVIGIAATNPNADFYFETNEISPGVANFSFWSEDSNGLKSTLLTLTFRVISRAVTTVTGVYLSPSIDVDKKSVTQGEDIKVFGQTVPDSEVVIHIQSPDEFIESTNSIDTGDWALVFDTEPLEEDFHTAKALFQVNVAGNIIKSAFSRSVSFYVGQLGGAAVCPEADLNHDGRVNLTDFSILLFYWGTDNACADQNQNGIVDLIDFSIMMYYWTG